MKPFSIAMLTAAVLLAHLANALVIPPGQVRTNLASETFGSLVISGTLVLATAPPIGGGEARTIVITNGDFVLAAGGVISQILYATTVTSNGLNGAAGTSILPSGGPGGPAGGTGTGGTGGIGYAPDNSTEAGDNGGDGGDGGDGGAIAGKGGQGGVGGRGANGDGTTSDGGIGGAGGAGGIGGNGPRAFSLAIINVSCGGNVRLDGQVDLRAGKGGTGGNSAAAGGGGNGDVPTDGFGGDGGIGGAGGAGGNGGAGGMLMLVASNGTVRLTNHDAWLSGAQGGSGGNGGNGGNGGSDTSVGGNGGDGGNSGNGANGGYGGSLTIVAGGIVTNGVQLKMADVVAANNGGAAGAAGATVGVGGTSGTPGSDGTPGVAGVSGPSGTNTFVPDLVPPVCAADPVIEPANGADVYEGVATTMVFSIASFSDNMTCTAALRQTIDIVPTNAVDGASLARIATDMWNVPANEATNFVPLPAWDGTTLCFRFITTDPGGNATTSAFPATHSFNVIPEPAAVLFLLWSAATRRRFFCGAA